MKIYKEYTCIKTIVDNGKIAPGKIYFKAGKTYKVCNPDPSFSHFSIKSESGYEHFMGKAFLKKYFIPPRKYNTKLTKIFYEQT